MPPASASNGAASAAPPLVPCQRKDDPHADRLLPCGRCRLRRPRSDAHTRCRRQARSRSEEHTSELQSLMRISYAVFCLKKKKIYHQHTTSHYNQLVPHNLQTTTTSH